MLASPLTGSAGSRFRPVTVVFNILGSAAAVTVAAGVRVPLAAPWLVVSMLRCSGTFDFESVGYGIASPSSNHKKKKKTANQLTCF